MKRLKKKKIQSYLCEVDVSDKLLEKRNPAEKPDKIAPRALHERLAIIVGHVHGDRHLGQERSVFEAYVPELAFEKQVLEIRGVDGQSKAIKVGERQALERWAARYQRLDHVRRDQDLMESEALQGRESREALRRVQLAAEEVESAQLLAAEEARGHSEPLPLAELEDELFDVVPREEQNPLVDVGAALEVRGRQLELVDRPAVEEQGSGYEVHEALLDQLSVVSQCYAFLVEHQLRNGSPFVPPLARQNAGSHRISDRQTG